MHTCARWLPTLLLALLAGACSSSATGGSDGGASASCTTATDCAPGQLCLDGACATPEASCGTRKKCDANANCGANGVCEGGCCLPSCASDADCAADESCRSNVCRELGSACTRATDCMEPSTPVCELETGACVGCTVDADCARGEYCESHRCRKPATNGCRSDADCSEIPQLSHCLAVEGRCVACLSDAQCPRPTEGTVTCDKTNYACRVVLPGCDSSADCARSSFGPWCDTSQRKCVACLVDGNCPSGSHCTSARTCEATPACTTDASCPRLRPHCRSDRTCVECLAGSDCPSGQLCQSNHCVARTNGCWNDQMCADPTPGCDLSTRTCVPCRNDKDCNGRICENGTCRACASGLECVTRSLATRAFCDQGSCVQCLNDTQCDPGLVCDRRACTASPVDQPCPSIGVCPGDLVCLSDYGYGPSNCRRRCDPYATSSTCPAGQRCTLARFSAGLPIGGCMPVLSGGAGEGDTCNDLQPCDSGLVCVPAAPDFGRCRRLCDPNRSTSTCSAPDQCQPIVFIDTLGIPQAVGACYPASRYLEPCTSDASCDPGMVCAPGPNPQVPTQFRNECRWPAGSKTAGQPCSTDPECRSGVCLPGMPRGLGSPGFCMGGCGTDADCPARADGLAGACEQYPVPWHDQSGAATTVNVNTCAVQCREDAECTPGYACEAVANASRTKWVTRCRQVPAGATGKGGAPCTSGTDCRSGTCVTFGTRAVGFCQGVCGGPAGASNCATGAECPSGGVMRYVGPGPDGTEHTQDDLWSSAPLCWGRACTSDADCGTARTCGADMDPQNRLDLVLSCRPSQGTKQGGDTCTQDGDCKSGFCVNWSSTNKRCFGACQQASDCAPGSTCKLRKWTNTTPNKDLRVCSP